MTNARALLQTVHRQLATVDEAAHRKVAAEKQRAVGMRGEEHADVRLVAGPQHPDVEAWRLTHGRAFASRSAGSAASRNQDGKSER